MGNFEKNLVEITVPKNYINLTSLSLRTDFCSVLSNKTNPDKWDKWANQDGFGEKILRNLAFEMHIRTIK